jgi:hypothetical protein
MATAVTHDPAIHDVHVNVVLNVLRGAGKRKKKALCENNVFAQNILGDPYL